MEGGEVGSLSEIRRLPLRQTDRQTDRQRERETKWVISLGLRVRVHRNERMKRLRTSLLYIPHAAFSVQPSILSNQITNTPSEPRFNVSMCDSFGSGLLDPIEEVD